MISSEFKKLAEKHNMNVEKGVAYGRFYDYAATFSDGAGFKLIQLTTTFPDSQKKTELETLLRSRDIMTKYHLKEVHFGEDYIIIAIIDNFGTMKKIDTFVEWFFPVLSKSDATKYNICTACNCEIISGHWKLINGRAYYLHDSCAEALKRSFSQTHNQKKQEDTGSYLKGIIGALLGSLLGSIVWAIFLCIGYIASVIGFVIGWLAEKGYNKLQGKQGKGKIAILLLAVIFGVLFGTVSGELITMVIMVAQGELPGVLYSDVPSLFLYLLSDTEYFKSVGINILIGIVFAILGIFSMLLRTNRDLSVTKVIDLP